MHLVDEDFKMNIRHNSLKGFITLILEMVDSVLKSS